MNRTSEPKRTRVKIDSHELTIVMMATNFQYFAAPLMQLQAKKKNKYTNHSRS